MAKYLMSNHHILPTVCSCACVLTSVADWMLDISPCIASLIDKWKIHLASGSTWQLPNVLYSALQPTLSKVSRRRVGFSYNLAYPRLPWINTSNQSAKVATITYIFSLFHYSIYFCSRSFLKLFVSSYMAIGEHNWAQRCPSFLRSIWQEVLRSSYRWILGFFDLFPAFAGLLWQQ